MAIDYAAFDQKPTIAQGFRETLSRLKTLFSISIAAKVTLLVYAFFLIGFVALTNILLLSGLATSTGSDATSLLVLIVILDTAIVALAIWGTYSYGARAATMRTFAEKNGFEFRPFFSTKSTSGTLFKIRPYNVHSRNAVLGSYEGVNFALFDHRYAIGTARFRNVRIFTVMGLNTGKTFPATLAQHNKGFMRKVRDFDRNNEIIMPGVPETYKVYSSAPSASSISPVVNGDVMDSLARTSRPADIELQGKDVFFYLEGQINDSDSISNLFEAIGNIQK